MKVATTITTGAQFNLNVPIGVVPGSLYRPPTRPALSRLGTQNGALPARVYRLQPEVRGSLPSLGVQLSTRTDEIDSGDRCTDDPEDEPARK
jgi:hypothetical protein